jgi:hypothetical protein
MLQLLSKESDSGTVHSITCIATQDGGGYQLIMRSASGESSMP